MARLAAGVRKRADGTLEKRITIDGKRYSIYGKTSKDIAEKEQDLRASVANGQYINNKNVTLDQYYEGWIERKRLKKTKSNSLRLYATNYREHISPSLGKKKVAQIETRELWELQKELSQRVAPTTCNLVFTILKIILNDADKAGIFVNKKNPILAVEPVENTSPKATKTIHRALTEEEQAAFMEEMRTDHYYELVALLISTGMRCGEACALEWNDIDYAKNVIHINKTVTYNEQGEPYVGDSPKTEAGIRDIPMTDNIKKILRMQREKSGNVFRLDGRIFSSTVGSLVTSPYITGTIQRALKRLDGKGVHIERFSAHALRDTFATRFIEQGGNPQTLKTILGHSSLAMTMDLYAQVLPNTKQNEMNNVFIAI